jgi:general secretion pathway protein G
VLQRLRAAREKESGFTLIELLIVIVILGILAAIVVFAVGAFNDRGEEAACDSDRKAVEIAAEAYRAQEDTYPVGLTSVDRINELVDPDGVPATADGYLREAPGTANYTITLNANGTVTGSIC